MSSFIRNATKVPQNKLKKRTCLTARILVLMDVSDPCLGGQYHTRQS